MFADTILLLLLFSQAAVAVSSGENDLEFCQRLSGIPNQISLDWFD